MAITKVTSGLISADASSIDLNIDAGTLYLDVSENRVGIGTTSPDKLLHLAASSGATLRLESTTTGATTGDIFGAIEFETQDSNSAGVKGKIDSYSEGGVGNAALRFFTGNTTELGERLRIDSSGNVGIGISPSNTFSVGASGTVTTRYTSTDTSAFSLLQFENSGSIVLSADHGNSAANSNIIFKSDGATERMRITAGGATRIVAGNSLELQNAAGNNEAIIRCDGAGTNTDLRFDTGGAERMRIDSSGNVGIGTTSPDSKLHLKESSANGVAQISWENDARRWAMGVHGGLSDGLSIYDVQGGVTRFYIGTNGNVGIGNDNTSPSSTLDVNGSLSKSSGSFKIDHPLESKKDTHHLVHSFVEAPQADNIYRGVVTLVDGSATINLDTEAGMTEGTFVLLNTNTSCFTSNESDWDAVKGSVLGNILTINCQNDSSTATISWLVIGERHDQHMLDTEWTDENGKVIVEPTK